MHTLDLKSFAGTFDSGVFTTNEWFIRDTSRKIRAVQKAKAERGERLGTRAPYGYVKDLETKKLVIDEEAAAVVKRIFALCAAGNGPSRIATILTKEKVLCPSYYTYQKYGLTHSALDITKPYHWSDSAVANLLENEIYLGNTVNYRFSTKSYKDKRKIEHPREECLVFENTHPAIIPKEVWDIVQRVRKNKRRRTKMDEQNKYSGLVICADCGKTMVLHRAHTMSADYNHFTCRTYKKDGEACTAHYIRECILDEIVLEDLRRVTAEAREHPQEFAEYLNSKQSAELQKEIRKLEKEKSAMQKRKAELDAIFKKLYEESVLGRITAEQFQMLVASYTDEQAKLTESLPQRESEIQRLKETVSNTAAFLDKAKRYTDIQALTPGEEGGLAELLAEGLAGQVVVGHLGDVPAHLLGDVLGHGEGAAQHLEGVEAEAEGLILHEQAAQAQIFGHAVQPGKGGDGVLGKGCCGRTAPWPRWPGT